MKKMLFRILKILYRIRYKIKIFYIQSSITNSINKPTLYGTNIVLVHPENLLLGKRVAFNSNIYINATNKIVIGSNVALSDGAKLITITLNYNLNPMNQEHIGGEIRIGNNVQIGAGAIVLPNVVIGDNVVVAAGSVVSKDVESNSITAGVPAKVIKKI